MTVLQKLLLCGLFVWIGFSILYPNPYGNNPDIIWDESYFLTSSLSALEHHTLPGWDFPLSGTYYGGPQTYLDTAVLVPVVGIVVASSHFSLTEAKVWIAQHTGEILHILRLVNGAAALLSILFLFFYFKKREVPRELALTLTLFLFLLLSNVLVFEFLHTAKMWALYIVIVAITSAFFIAQEYYTAHFDQAFLSKKTYVALLVWSAVLTFFQSYFGVFTIGLLILYALALQHIHLGDIIAYVRRRWYLIGLFALTQISFLYQAYRIRGALADASTRLADGSIDWWARLTKPVLFTIESQPLVVLYVVGVLALLFFALYKGSSRVSPRTRMYIAIAAAHPILSYLIFQVGLGFDILPRYGIMLTVAFCFSIAILMSALGLRATLGALALGGLLFALISAHGIALYWQPSSETVLVQTIEAKYNSPENIFITDHSARRMTLPVNAASLLLLDEKRQHMSRFAFLLQNRMSLPPSEFKAITFTAYADEEQADVIARLATPTNSVWVITRNCSNLCSEDESRAGTCFSVNTSACGIEPQEVNTLPVFLGAQQLGYSYIVRRVR